MVAGAKCKVIAKTRIKFKKRAMPIASTARKKSRFDRRSGLSWKRRPRARPVDAAKTALAAEAEAKKRPTAKPKTIPQNLSAVMA